MKNEFIKLSAENLLKEFGSGKPIPGSGSAAALQGLFSAQLILTVIKLTKKCDAINLENITNEIEKEINPKLLKLFQKDSEIFEKVIMLRKSRDQEQEPIQWGYFSRQEKQKLKLATKIVILIAKQCTKLAEFSCKLFDYGFQAARGDTKSALNYAISGLDSCLSIVNLNLITIPSDENLWLEKVNLDIDSLNVKRKALFDLSAQKFNQLEEENSFSKNVEKLQSESKKTDLNIETKVERFLELLWKNRTHIWKKDVPENPIDMLNSELILKKMFRYKINKAQTLGYHQENSKEIAGVIDMLRKKIDVSESFNKEVQNFTVAHELGHVLLHFKPIMHREIALDHPLKSTTREKEEQQADKFAACFLMPKKLTTNVFRNLFSTEKFIINDETLFKLLINNKAELKAKYKNKREFARFLAGIKFYDGKPITPISEQFKVSIEAMAIRLEELNLFEY